MRVLPIASIAVDSAGSLYVRLKTDQSYEYIYREANGLRWDREKRALQAYEPLRWKPAELLQHMAATLRECRDEALAFDDSTSWEGVSADLQDSLRKVLAGK